MMEISRQLEECCIGLVSTGIRIRTKACADLTDLLHNSATINFLANEDSTIDWWNNVLSSIRSCLYKDHEKKLEESKKKGFSVLMTAPQSVDLFTSFVRIICKETPSTINFRKLLEYVINNLTDPQKIYFLNASIKILSHFLSNSWIRSLLTAQDWVNLYQNLKFLCEDKSIPEGEYIKCLVQVVKWGPLYNFPVSFFREEFNFVAHLCQTVTYAAPKHQQEAMMELVNEYCKHVAKDNRMACCKLGEDIFENLINLYKSNANEDLMKANLVDFFLFQVSIHNPKGVAKNHPAAYAVSWPTWRNCLYRIYTVLIEDILVNLASTVKNQVLFVVKNGVKQLFDKFVFLYVQVCKQLLNDGDFYTGCENLGGPPQKRQKIDLSVENLFEKIKETKSWTWINLTNSLIETCPDIITSDNYITFLKILTTFQAECNDDTLNYHIYKGFLVLETIDTSQTPEINQLWKTCADCALRSLRSFVLDNDDQLIQLIQRLISKKIITTHETLFQNYRLGGALIATTHNLQTLDLAFQNFNYLQMDVELKVKIMGWILNNNLKYLSELYVAQILVGLILKQYTVHLVDVGACKSKPFEDLEDVYWSISFEQLLVGTRGDNSNKKIEGEVFCADEKLQPRLFEAIANATKSFNLDNDVESLLYVTVLIFNVLSYLNKLDVIESGAMEQSDLYKLFDSYLMKLFDKLDISIERNDERLLEKITNYVQILNSLFSTNISIFMSTKLREAVSEEFLKSLFAGLLTENGDNTRNSLSLNFKRTLIQALINFSCGPHFDELLQNQKRVLEALVTTDYDCTKDADYELVLTLLESIKATKVEMLSEDILISIFNLFQNLCETRYHCYRSAVKILHLFYEMYPIVATSNSHQFKKQFVKILETFYTKRSDYGPELSVALVNCMGLLFEWDPDCTYTLWSNEEIVIKIPEFLASDYQVVRYAAIVNIVNFFKISAKTQQLRQFHRQEIMFMKIAEMNLELLQIKGNPNQELIIDETITRRASVLHMYASIMVTSHLWIEESLFTLLKTVCEKNIDLVQVNRVLEMVSKNLKFESCISFLETYLVGLFKWWGSYNIDKFPFVLFNCDSKIKFYAKYWAKLAPIIIEIDYDNVNLVATSLNQLPQEIIQANCSQLLTYCIVQEVTDLSFVKNNKIYKLLCDVLGLEMIRELFETRIDEIFLSLMDFVSDASDFKKNFNENFIFIKINVAQLSVEQFQDCVQFIENTIFQGNTLMIYLVKNKPDKIHAILLHLKIKIDNARALEEKMRWFHLYSTVTLLCLEDIVENINIQTYLIRDVTYHLLHLINNYKNQLELSRISCKFLNIILKKIVPSLADVVKEFLLVILSRLKNIALEDCPVSDYCINMLQYLIVENKNYFLDEIAKLDSVPQTPKFAKIYAVHYDIKYKDRQVTLEDEITQFLDFANNVESFDSLKHLHNLLSSSKNELAAYFQKLRQTRSSSDSHLHKLICTLITLSCSSNCDVSVEALRCLGEIGPADLATLVLQLETPKPDTKWASSELLLGYSLSLFCKYLIDEDVEVIKATSKALFQILRTKEGRKLAESQVDFGFGMINCKFFTPFLLEKIDKSNFDFRVDTGEFLKKFRNNVLWIPEHNCHKKWITELLCTILGTFQKKSFFTIFVDVCKLKTDFCEQILPLVIYAILEMDVNSLTNLICRYIQDFFDHHWRVTVLENNPKIDVIVTNKASVQCMLNVVHFLRLQKSTRKRQLKELNLSYLQIAKAAHFCTAYFTAILYAELWCQQQNIEYYISTIENTKLELIYEKLDKVTGNALYNILREAYKSIGEIHALLGCGTSQLLNSKDRINLYKEQGRWDLATYACDIDFSLDNENSLPLLVDSFSNSNLYQSSLSFSKFLNEPHYESLWRLGQWDHKQSMKSANNSQQNFDKTKFCCLKALHDSDEFRFKKSIEQGRFCIVQNLQGVNVESCKHLYGILSQVQSLKEIEDWVKALDENKIADILDKWRVQDEIINNDFQYIEPIQAQRIVVLNDFLRKNSQRNNLGETIIENILGFAKQARLEGKSTIATRVLEVIRHLPNLPNDAIAKMQLEEAQLCWSLHDAITSNVILRQLYTNENVNPRLHAMALKLTGEWMVGNSSENRQTIIVNYFQKSIELLKANRQNNGDGKTILDTYDQLAKFADCEYQQIMTHIKSDVFQKKKANMEKSNKAVSNLNMTNATKDLRKAVVIKKKLSCLDENEIKTIETEKNNLLQFALKYYLLNLIESDHHNITIFRLFSLMLENRTNVVIQPILKNHLYKIPAYKFIDILPQIIPHISGNDDLFSQTINRVVEKCAKEHPYHTIPLILALALSNEDRIYTESTQVVNEARMQSARKSISSLKKDPKLSNLIMKMELVSEALIELAYCQQKNNEVISLKVPMHSKIRQIKNYDDVLLPTYNLPIDKTCTYDRIIGIRCFSDVYCNMLTGNVPKRITCQGTDGKSRMQLLKGQEDLRQDAVMQQVFTIMNSLLAANKQTKCLLIRTYKIVPLSMRSGVLEWVQNTTPIGEYLVGEKGNGGAHVKYRPDDMEPRLCAGKFKQLGNKPHDEKLRIFTKICSKIQPVLHKFFETNFLQPTVWYERRRAYIHSVATTSMCGYILGIGDRHLSNILIDKNTAEVIHIDFGIAFEQGRVLNVPETVPFRLTRDIVDGMGVSGAEGVFRNACEKTIEVLRVHKHTIMTILEVLLYDPLYHWIVSTSQANRRQNDAQNSELNTSILGSGDENSSEDVNVSAERALLRLRAKLQGTESGRPTTVQTQVDTLIQQAVDPSNLCRLFVGWTPYL